MSCARGDRLLACRVGTGKAVGVEIGEKLGQVVGAVFKRNAKEMMSLSAPDDFASVEIGLPDSEGARIGNELESLLEGSGPSCAGGYFVHDGPLGRGRSVDHILIRFGQIAKRPGSPECTWSPQANRATKLNSPKVLRLSE